MLPSASTGLTQPHVPHSRSVELHLPKIGFLKERIRGCRQNVTHLTSQKYRTARNWWDPKAYDNIKNIRIPSDKIWLPDIVLYNFDLPMVRGWQTHDRYLLAGQIQELMAKVLSLVSQIYSIQLVAEREAGSLL
ncbi:hypothetical protein RRG08_018581 [Elysia crispata]|uniref:Neurotransmitter-gated ion-channel ligand-binding domain-containing protein n=1 Tax=Elysia crispata TaxID=231223 RepID=A0AAE1A718_9GAST|nr:hypothetical protein RRG08_018581 [Elysia crispata]